MEKSDYNNFLAEHEDRTELSLGWQDGQFYGGSRYAWEMLTFLLLIGPAGQRHQTAQE